MKKFFGAIFAALIISNSALAMNFSQAVKIGEVGENPYEDKKIFLVKGADYNGGGVARWGKLFCRYDGNLNFGGENNFIFKDNYNWREIVQINSDEGLTVYLLYYRKIFSTSLEILWRRNDNTWQNISLDDMSKNFFGENVSLTFGAKDWAAHEFFKSLSCEGDNILIPYYINPYEKNQKFGNFKLTWDDAAQDFCVENILLYGVD